MNRRVSQNIDYMNFNSAKLSVKLCETLRDILFFYFLVTPLLITNTLLDFSPKYNTFRSGLMFVLVK